MRASVIAPLALVAGASAWDNVTYTTEVVTAYTTYCPGPTHIVQDQKTYTVTEATTLTFDCPCTVTKPVVPTLAPPKYTSTPVAVPTVHAVVPEVSVAVETHPAPAAPASPETAVVEVPAPAGPTASAPSAAPITPTAPSAPIFTGAASNVAASGMGLAGLAAVAAFFL